jgi:hypothetical protein
VPTRKYGYFQAILRNSAGRMAAPRFLWGDFAHLGAGFPRDAWARADRVPCSDPRRRDGMAAQTAAAKPSIGGWDGRGHPTAQPNRIVGKCRWRLKWNATCNKCLDARLPQAITLVVGRERPPGGAFPPSVPLPVRERVVTGIRRRSSGSSFAVRIRFDQNELEGPWRMSLRGIIDVAQSKEFRNR